MSFKDLLVEKLDGKIENIERLPKGFQKIGDVIVLNLDDRLIDYKKEIGLAVVDLFGVRTVCNKKGKIIGEFREPQIEVIAGDLDTVTTHVEHGCKYKFDIRKVMFAKGNISERVRIAKLVKDGEIVFDMFAGLGYFSVPIGKLSKAKEIYSVELNPVSFEYLKENLRINHIHNVNAINGDCREEIDKLVSCGLKADRVVMGYLPPPREYLNWAFKVIKKYGTLHYEDLVRVGHEEVDVNNVVNEIGEVAREFGFYVELLISKKVKSYGPKIDHYVFDILVR